MPDCYLCGGAASTIDHIPPQGIFPVVPANIIQLDACEGCNRGASLDEEYMRTILAAMGYDHSAAAREVWEGPVKRSFARRPKGLRAMLAQAVRPVMVQTATGMAFGHYAGIGIDGRRALRVFRKIAQGLYFHECGRTLSQDELLLFRDADVKMNFRVITQGWPEIDMGDPFRSRAQHSVEGSFIWFEFYRAHWWLAVTGDLAKQYPRQ